MRPNPQETAYLVTLTKEILNEKLHFCCSVVYDKSDSIRQYMIAIMQSARPGC